MAEALASALAVVMLQLYSHAIKKGMGYVLTDDLTPEMRAEKVAMTPVSIRLWNEGVDCPLEGLHPPVPWQVDCWRTARLAQLVRGSTGYGQHQAPPWRTSPPVTR